MYQLKETILELSTGQPRMSTKGKTGRYRGLNFRIERSENSLRDRKFRV